MPIINGASGMIPRGTENTGNNNKSWINSETCTPRNSTNTKECARAWLEDGEREKIVC